MKKVKVRNKDGTEEEITIPDEWYCLLRLIEDELDELRKDIKICRRIL